MTRVGVVSDTHGLMRPEALAALEGSELILHAGDVGSPEILEALRAIAPVVAVRGNNDKGAWADGLPAFELVTVEATSVYVLHDVADLDLDPVAAGIGVVIFGHSHKPLVERRRGALYLNPGSAGPRRFTLPIAVARLTVEGASAEAEVVPLEPNGAPRGR